MNTWEIISPVATVFGAAAWAALHPRSQVFGSTIYKVENGCALTFDDGPNPRVTPKLLALLEKHRVPATFFVLGKYVEQHPSLAREIAAAKHTIGNHTYSHPSLLFCSQRRIVDELNRCKDAVAAATGQSTTLVRPPFGFRGPQFHLAAQKTGISKIVMWSISGHDWNLQPYSHVTRRIQKTKARDIVLLHDGDHRIPNADRSPMLEALGYWLPQWQDTGLKFVEI